VSNFDSLLALCDERREMAEGNAHWLRPPVQLPSQGALTNDATEFQAATPKGAKLPKHVGHSGKRPSKKVHKNKAASLDLLGEAILKMGSVPPPEVGIQFVQLPHSHHSSEVADEFEGG
jgi:hypothetical protein